MFGRRVETIKSKTRMGKRRDFIRKYISIFLLLLTGFSIAIKECDGQFQWGVNYRLEALKLKQMLSHLKPRSGIQTSPPVRFHYTLNILDSF